MRYSSTVAHSAPPPKPVPPAWRFAAPILALALLAAAQQPEYVRLTISAPAGSRPAGPLGAGSASAAILPSGQIVDPLGRSVQVGATVSGFAIVPGGRYAVIAGGAGAAAGGSLTVVDTRWMALVSRYAVPQPVTAVTAVRDPANPAKTLVLATAGAANAVDVLTLEPGGQLVPDAKPAVPIPPPLDEALGNFGWAVPATILPSRDGRHAYVVNLAGASVVTVDVATRAVVGVATSVGFAPYAAAIASGSLLVANEGLMLGRALAPAATVPTFALPSYEPGRSSSLSVVALERAGGTGDEVAALPLDGPTDGVRAVGGAQPAAIATTPNGAYAFVAMAGVDRIATVSLRGRPQVVGGTELRLYGGGPYGTQPVALALARTGTTLFVALAGVNAVAVLDARDPRHLHRLGLLPTGWCPTALALSSDSRRLFVANARGTESGSAAESGSFERIDLERTVLRPATIRALADLRSHAPAQADTIVPQLFAAEPSAAIKHVVLILAGDRTFDAMLGDLRGSDPRVAAAAAPALVRFGAEVTPNLHALAQSFGIAGNFYNDAPRATDGDALVLGGMQSPYAARVDAAGIVWPAASGVSPDDYPRAGYLYNSLAARHAAFRDYGVLIDVPGSRSGIYHLDVPALAALAGNVDLRFAGDDPSVSNAPRADEFVADYGRVADAARVGDPGHVTPAFVSVRLASVVAGFAERDTIADQDRALGRIVDDISHQPSWASTAIFVVPEAATRGGDHVDPHRSYALVISPYAKRGYLGMRHLSTASVLKTEEELLGLPALSLADALATDMSDFFAPEFDAAPYDARGTGKRAAGPGGE